MIGERYSLGEKLGEGGMGTVYKGIDTVTNQPVAIKILRAEIAQGDMLTRFQREGELLRQLNHPNIVKLLDTVHEPPNNALIMEFVSGGSLAGSLQRKEKLPIPRIIEIALDLADALTRAHRLNIIHRDIKPDNVLLAEDGMPRLTDFGIASTLGSNLTQTGMVVGTVAYLSPEQLQGGETTILSDIWAFGVTLFEMVAGQPLFHGDQFYSIMNAIVEEPIPNLEALRPDAPVALLDLIYRMLAKNPAERIPSVRLVGAELEALLQNHRSGTNGAVPVSRIVPASAFATTPAAQAATRHNLPHQTTPFVGREHEIEVLQQLLGSPTNQLVTILGPGGMGKTRLSIETGSSLLARFPQGVYFVELAPLASSASIPMAVAEAVGYPSQRDGRTPEQQMVEFFRDKAHLLILDNFEHVVDGRAFVQAILQASSQLKILVTSRERLNLSGETVLQLEGMDFPDYETPADVANYAAMRLFLESAKRVRPDYQLSTDDVPYAARICRLVQGLPLALVLAGTWLEILSLREIAEEIASNIDFLESSLHDIPERQRTMRAVFDYSWKLLSEVEQQVFTRLAVFRGGMTRDAAQAVADANLRTLQTLVNKSIVRRDNVTGRYEIHELLRQYAHETLEKTGSLPAIQHKHAAFYTAFSAARDADIKGRRQLPALHEIESDFENIKTAWRYACAQSDAQLVGDMLETVYWFCIFRSRVAEGMDLFHTARQVWRITGQSTSSMVARLAVRCPDMSDDYGPLYEQALAVAEQFTDPREIAFCKRQLGHWRSHSQANHVIGVPLMEASLSFYRSLGDNFYAAILLDDLGWSHNLLGDNAAQTQCVEQSLELRRQIGDKIGVANSLRNLGGAHGGFGTNSPKPVEDWQEALQLAREIGDRSSIAWNNYLLNIYWQYTGEFEKAQPYREEAHQVAAEINETVIRGLCLISDALDSIFLHQDYERARQLTLQGYPPDSPFDLRWMLSSMNNVFIGIAQNEALPPDDAVARFFENAIQMRRNQVVAVAVFLISYGAYRDKHFDEAAELMGTILSDTLPFYRMLKRWNWFKRYQTELETELGADAYMAAVERGRAQELVEIATKIHKTLTKTVS